MGEYHQLRVPQYVGRQLDLVLDGGVVVVPGHGVHQVRLSLLSASGSQEGDRADPVSRSLPGSRLVKGVGRADARLAVVGQFYEIVPIHAVQHQLATLLLQAAGSASELQHPAPPEYPVHKVVQVVPQLEQHGVQQSELPQTPVLDQEPERLHRHGVALSRVERPLGGRQAPLGALLAQLLSRLFVRGGPRLGGGRQSGEQTQVLGGGDALHQAEPGRQAGRVPRGLSASHHRDEALPLVVRQQLLQQLALADLAAAAPAGRVSRQAVLRVSAPQSLRQILAAAASSSFAASSSVKVVTSVVDPHFELHSGRGRRRGVRPQHSVSLVGLRRRLHLSAGGGRSTAAFFFVSPLPLRAVRLVSRVVRPAVELAQDDPRLPLLLDHERGVDPAPVVVPRRQLAGAGVEGRENPRRVRVLVQRQALAPQALLGPGRLGGVELPRQRLEHPLGPPLLLSDAVFLGRGDVAQEGAVAERLILQVCWKNISLFTGRGESRRATASPGRAAGVRARVPSLALGVPPHRPSDEDTQLEFAYSPTTSV